MSGQRGVLVQDDRGLRLELLALGPAEELAAVVYGKAFSSLASALDHATSFKDRRLYRAVEQ